MRYDTVRRESGKMKKIYMEFFHRTASFFEFKNIDIFIPFYVEDFSIS